MTKTISHYTILFLLFAVFVEVMVLCSFTPAGYDVASAREVTETGKLKVADTEYVPVPDDPSMNEADNLGSDVAYVTVPDVTYATEPNVAYAAEPEDEVVWTETVVDESEMEHYSEPASYDYDDEVVYEEDIYTASDDAESSDGNGYVVDANVDGNWISGADFMFNGVYTDGSGYSYTYYSENVLPGGGLDIPGRHVGEEGYVCDGDGNICIASDDLPYGTVVNVPFGNGTAVVYDCGSGYGNLDVYTAW